MKKRFLLHKDKEEKIGIADANLAHLQVAPADTRPKLAKELQPTEGSSRVPLKINKMASNFAYTPVLNCYF